MAAAELAEELGRRERKKLRTREAVLDFLFSRKLAWLAAVTKGPDGAIASRPGSTGNRLAVTGPTLFEPPSTTAAERVHAS